MAIRRSLRRYAQAVALLGLVAFARGALGNGADLPSEIVLQGFVKSDDGTLHLLVRVPLVLLSSFSLPKRGVGYLDLANIGDKLKQAATATGNQIELAEDGRPLDPTVRAARISLLSDRSFDGYASALADLHGPPLSVDTDLFWNQGFFDVELEYARRAPDSELAIRVNVAPELGQRLKLRLEFLPVAGPSSRVELSSGPAWTLLNPHWYQAAWLFVKQGFLDVFTLDRLVFLLCLIAPFRRFSGMLGLILAAAALQSVTLTATARGALGDNHWILPLFETGLAVAVVLLAIGNLGVPSLRRRWFLAVVVGGLGGFVLGHIFEDVAQFGAGHTIVSMVGFNLGVVAGEIVSLLLALFVVRGLLDRMLSPLLAVIVISAVLGHMSWHAMIDGAHELAHQLGHAREAGVLSAQLRAAGWWLLPAFLVGVAGFFLPREFGGTPFPTLLSSLRGRDTF